MNIEILIAIIGGVATIIAAVIAAIVSNIKRNKRHEKNRQPQGVQSGANTIMATGHAIQTVTISTQNQPEEDVPAHELLVISSQIKTLANKVLVKNQTIISPLLQKRPDKYRIQRSLFKLFMIQENRGDFGEWNAQLESYLVGENDPQIKTAISELLGLLSQLHNTLYSYSLSSRRRKSKYKKLQNANQYFLLKHSVLYALEENYKLFEVRRISTDYLEYLRVLVENIGSVNGKLKALIKQ